MVDVVGDVAERDGVPGFLTVLIARLEHPGVEAGADDGAALDEQLDLLIGVLAVAGDDDAAIVMAGEDRAGKEIDRLAEQSQAQGLTLVPLRMYARKGHAKVELAVARGKKHYDKRAAITERESKRELDRVVKEAYAGGR